MEILGVGGAEMVTIFVIMLVVAGPKRMIQWAYVLGQYVAKFRVMWAEVMAGVQKEIDDAGLDVQLPTSIPTRTTLNSLANPVSNVWAGITAPVQDVMNDVSSEIKQTHSDLRDVVTKEKVAS
jgi:Sec-independent protein translocase protein TatA